MSHVLWRKLATQKALLETCIAFVTAFAVHMTETVDKVKAAM